MELDLNCRHFPGDRPCRLHKETGARCEGCAVFAPPGFRVLVIKLDALGDVLRTTSVLPALRRDHPDAHVTWLTLPGAEPVLRNNPHIDEILFYDAEGFARLAVEEFDLVLAPDASKKSAALGSLARGRVKRGYRLGGDGQVRPWNEDGEEWLVLGGRDDLKKANRKTYQDHLHRICGLDARGQEIVLCLTGEERLEAERIFAAKGLVGGAPVIGFNTGSSSRWPKKRWPKESYVDLARRIREGSRARVVLLGGPLEAERNRWIEGRTGGWAVDAGSNHPLRIYLALLGRSDAVVTGDTLGLHGALALGTPVVALFGPTSSHEVDLYGRGVRITPEMDCLCCYLTNCSKRPDCMDAVLPERVMDALLPFLEGTGHGMAHALAGRAGR
ncbi:MAG: glycosyltransferase family 9 protein [Candidatus Eisenbacteria bacterium]